jgi:hypothetical protein
VLKSFLSKSGLSDDELRTEYGHKLEELWSRSLPIGAFY